MAQTISELEKERAELLKAIESQAQNISSSRSKDPAQDGHSLKDWLSAAEEVIPSEPKINPKSAQPTKPSANDTPPKKPANSNGKASFFGVIILLSLLLTILGVLYIAYNTINSELQEVKEVKANSQTETLQLQESMNKLQQTVATGGTPERFIELEQRVIELERQLAEIQQQQTVLIAKLESQSAAKQTATHTAAASVTASGSDKVVTEAILDEKLKSYTTGLERRIDEKLEMILQFLTQGEVKADLKDKVLLNGAAEQAVPDSASALPAPAEPQSPTVTTPRIKQPLVKMVESVAKPQAPKVEKPLQDYSEDVKWLLAQPAQHYVLQLASMTDKQALINMVRQKGLSDTRIVVQTRDDSQRYVLIAGSYANRKEANQQSKAIKQQFGIAPWVRKMKDLTSKLP